MPWFKIDDGFHSHPKVIAAGNAAIGLWARCGSWSSDQLTDGFVPAAVARMYGSAAEAKALVREGLWDAADGGYLMHDFHDFNPTAETVRAEREAAAERQRRHRESRKASHRDNERDVERDEQRDSPDRNGVSSPSPTRPDPNLPVTPTDDLPRAHPVLAAHQHS